MKTKYLRIALIATLLIGSISFTSCGGNEGEADTEENHDGHDHGDHEHDDGDDHEGHEH